MPPTMQLYYYNTSLLDIIFNNLQTTGTQTIKHRDVMRKNCQYKIPCTSHNSQKCKLRINEPRSGDTRSTSPNTGI